MDSPKSDSEKKNTPKVDSGADQDSKFTRIVRKSAKIFTWWDANKFIAVFTAIICGIGILQYLIYRSQLHEMSVDQRPWIMVTFQMSAIGVAVPIGGTVRLINNGKTPARNVRADMVIQEIRNGDIPKLDYPVPHTRYIAGTMFPNSPSDNAFVMVRPSADGRSEVPDELTAQDLQDFRDVKLFFVVYGTVSYTDFSNVPHWTKFCQPELVQNPSGTATFKNCTEYNDVDGN